MTTPVTVTTPTEREIRPQRAGLRESYAVLERLLAGLL